MSRIADYKKYTSDMKKSCWDKAFFCDKIPGVKLIIDFGCADGSLMSFVRSEFPGFDAVGYDIDQKMVRLANKNGLRAFSDFASVEKYVHKKGFRPKEIAVNFSSVLHEVFHYEAPLQPIRDFLCGVDPAYIIVRDMMYEGGLTSKTTDPTDEQVASVKKKLPLWQVEDFERIYGSISDGRNFMHLLLKYRYTDNWKRECEENYFSFKKIDVANLFATARHTDVLWVAHYTPPWIIKRAEKDFGTKIRPTGTTHVSYIFRRNVDVYHS